MKNEYTGYINNLKGTNKNSSIDDFEKMLNTYDFSDIQSLEKFLEENRKEK